VTHVGGIDLGGTKIEARLFDDRWAVLATRRLATPTDDYDDLVTALHEQIRWLQAEAGDPELPVGVGAPGLINPATGIAFTANLPATGRTLSADLSARSGKSVPFLNDCRAFALSEAALGAGRDHATVAGLVLGTGVAGGLVVNGALAPTQNGQGGELGHCAISHQIVERLGLPIRGCGCGRIGCYETLLSGPGLQHLAQHVTGNEISPEDLAARVLARDTDAELVYQHWLQLAAELVDLMMMTYDPNCIVLGGGLSHLPNLCARLVAQTAKIALPGTAVPQICLAEGGDSSGARGAALFAKRVAQSGQATRSEVV